MTRRPKKLDEVLGARIKPSRFDDHCTHCGNDLNYEVLVQLFSGVRLDSGKDKTCRYACPHCGSIQLIHLQVSFVVQATGMRRKRK
jgi:predicted RNA-binding Zn-ribbon protein involved in translation (DUF1610 family)